MGTVGWAIFGIAMFFGSLAVSAVLLVRAPDDFFLNGANGHASRSQHPVRRILKNVLGGAIVAAGTAMLFMPGQGVLTILLGLTLVDFPGKRRLIRSLLQRPKLLDAADRLRARYGRPPFRVPDDLHHAS